MVRTPTFFHAFFVLSDPRVHSTGSVILSRKAPPRPVSTTTQQHSGRERGATEMGRASVVPVPVEHVVQEHGWGDVLKAAEELLEFRKHTTWAGETWTPSSKTGFFWESKCLY